MYAFRNLLGWLTLIWIFILVAKRLAIVAFRNLMGYFGLMWIFILVAKWFLLAFVALVCISEFIGIFYVNVNLHFSCQKALKLEIIAFLIFRIYMYFFCGQLWLTVRLYKILGDGSGWYFRTFKTLFHSTKVEKNII